MSDTAAETAEETPSTPPETDAERSSREFKILCAIVVRGLDHDTDVTEVELTDFNDHSQVYQVLMPAGTVLTLSVQR